MIRTAICGFGFFALAGAMLSISAAQKDQTRNTSIESVNPPSGSELYTKHCATCHGSDLKGDGPFPTPYRVPPDLTTLAKRHGGKFPNTYGIVGTLIVICLIVGLVRRV